MLQSLFLTTVPSSCKSRRQYNWPSRVRCTRQRDEGSVTRPRYSFYASSQATERRRIIRLGIHGTKCMHMHLSIGPFVRIFECSRALFAEQFLHLPFPFSFDSHLFFASSKGERVEAPHDGRCRRCIVDMIDCMTDPDHEPSDDLISTTRNRGFKIPRRTVVRRALAIILRTGSRFFF